MSNHNDEEDGYGGSQTTGGADIGGPLAQRSEMTALLEYARKNKRSVTQFMKEAEQLVTTNEKIAEGCLYALPRRGKGGQKQTIEGPSARFAEIIQHAWGNCRAGARPVDEDNEFVYSQGVFVDLEKNVTTIMEVRRRITDSDGRRYGADMIGVTSNAAGSIAHRNAVLKGIPKAFWQPIYQKARECAVGDLQTLANKRSEMLAYFQKLGVSDKQVFDYMEVKGIEDIGLEQLAELKGIATSIKEGDRTPEEVFGEENLAIASDTRLKNGSGSRLSEIKERHGVGAGKNQPSQSQAETAAASPGEAAAAAPSASTSSSTLTPEQRRAAEEAQARIEQRRQEEQPVAKAEGLPGIFDTPQPAIAGTGKKK